MKLELDQKRDVFTSMETEMEKAAHWSSQASDGSLRCDLTLDKYSQQVGRLTDRWRRIQMQIDSRCVNSPYVHTHSHTSTHTHCCMNV